MNTTDVAVVGGGPAGMAAACRLRDRGVARVTLVERNPFLGGILPQCIHTGFGLSYFGEDWSGPEYARGLQERVRAGGIEVMTGTAAVGLAPGPVLTLASKARGLAPLGCRAVLLTTGCRERTRENIEVAGSRPAGVFTAGQAQYLVNLLRLRIGRRVVIQGSGDIGLILARRLQLEGCEVIRVLERLPFLSGLVRNKVQCLDDFEVPLEFRRQIVEIRGKDRVQAVVTAALDGDFRPIPGSEETIECDTVVFSVGLIQELELGKQAGVRLQGPAPLVDASFQTSVDGVWTAGNALQIHDLADGASRQAEAAADRIADELTGVTAPRKAFVPQPPAGREAETVYDEEFFRKLKTEGRVVCVVCPKGCTVDAETATCVRGSRFFAEEATRRPRVLTTTVEGWALRTCEPVPLARFPEVLAALQGVKEVTAGEFSVSTPGGDWRVRAVQAPGLR